MSVRWPNAEIFSRLPSALQMALSQVSKDADLTPTLAVRFAEIAAGMSNAQIAERHGLTVNTVKTEVSHVLAAVGVMSRTAIRSAFEAAAGRADAGASETELVQFLKIRFE